MMFDGVTIPLNCVVIQDIKDGHTAYSSGTGSDGVKYFAKVSASAAGGSFLISTSPSSSKCGASESYGITGPGSFVITAF